MSMLVRRLILLVLGLLAAVSVWPSAEVFLLLQDRFPTYFIFNLAQGAVFGLILGVFFGAGEGLVSGIKKRIVKGMLAGGIIGLAGGAVGFLAGQGVLFFVGDLFIRWSAASQSTGGKLPDTSFLIVLARASGWAVLGVFIGMIEGIRARSLKKLLNGVLGGFIGGVLGGICLEYLNWTLPVRFLARLAGLVLFCSGIAVFYGIIEQSMSMGVLRVLNGKLKDKEYLINQNKLRLGKSTKNDLCFWAYGKASDFQAELRVKKKTVSIRSLDRQNPVYVNDRPVEEAALKFEDVIRLGDVKLYFKA